MTKPNFSTIEEQIVIDLHCIPEARKHNHKIKCNVEYLRHVWVWVWVGGWHRKLLKDMSSWKDNRMHDRTSQREHYRL